MNPLQTAILRHMTTDGLHHFDWLLAGSVTVRPEARETLCWRCPRLLTKLNMNERMVIEALPKHRGLYLTLNGARELDGGRGTVEPIARGWAQELQEQNHASTKTVAQHTPLTASYETAMRRHFILRFEHADPMCVTLQDNQLTRVEHFTNLNARD